MSELPLSNHIADTAELPDVSDNQDTYAHCALPLPLNQLFTYRVPADLTGYAEPGRRAVVPLGKRLVTGFIIETGDSPGELSAGRIKDIHDIIDDQPVFDTQMLDLARWVADYYLASLGDVLKTAMPFAASCKSRTLIRPNPDFDDMDSLSPRQRNLLDLLEPGHPLTPRTLQKRLGQTVGNLLKALEQKGAITRERELHTSTANIKTERYVQLTGNILEPPGKRAKEQLRCFTVLSNHPEGIALGELLERYSISRGVVNALVEHGHARYIEIEVTRRSKLLDQESVIADHPLTEDQRNAVALIMAEATSSSPKPILLHGVTGSGKTRVYIEMVREVLAHDKSAIILVPEISLTPQTTRFFTSVFPGRVTVIHSAMSTGERYDAWRQIREGRCDVVIGPRSAVFAPARNPGIIIVDEEHDTSYKQTDRPPLYNARDVAVMRGHISNIPVVLGSATPSIESWYNASLEKYRLATLSERIDSRPLPEVVRVDMRKEWQAGNNSLISLRLRTAIEETVARGEKCIILINRRGFSTQIQCKDCNTVIQCPTCDSALTWHASKGLAICHICGHKQLILEHCPECGSSEITHKGMGTQRIEQQLSQIVDENAIVRMDADTTSSHDAHLRLLEEFRSGHGSVLLGTQMVAKGLDIAEVTLVGIISTDMSLYIPDFRSRERTFQLITQVAGRAGRGEAPGKVIVQTLNPDNETITAACKHDYHRFIAREISEREELDFPPFSRLVLLELKAKQISALETYGEWLASYLMENAPADTDILGPIPAPIARVRGIYRYHILIKTRKIAAVRYLLRHYTYTANPWNGTVTINTDPTDIL